ncbi:Mu transposase C-terminal domain-containing protein [uncultured Litoreibacter sp.]|uniref:Mu transposase C-terminal domain-containing protein n=1 Tax=uncultured Litoreibacter sp. TaxID=1392394 RepID=UPI00262FD87C|nr:Mu transposase C-terminal domain-containing protein [uncultured Litoreibacter sp.]
MSFPMKVSSLDRLTVDAQTYKNAVACEQGYTFDRLGKSQETIFFSFEEFRALLKQPDVLLEPDYFLVERQKLRETGVADSISTLPDETRAETMWRYVYVTVFLELWRAGKVKKTELSVQVWLPEIERHVNKLARSEQDGWLRKRAGKKRVYRVAPCPRTLLEWVRRFEQSGNSALALVPKTFRSGNWKDRFSLEELRFLGQCIGDYLTLSRLSKRRVSENTKIKFEAENVKRAELGLRPFKVPSRRKVEREIAKLDPYTTYAQRHGIEAANRAFMLYETGVDASYPMERIEIDEWNVDLITILAERGALDHLSAEQLAALPRGRRWLYLAIDAATRCVLGMRLCETPNAQDAIALLADVTCDKSSLSAAAGCRSIWGQYGGLKTVATDLGAAFVDDRFRAAVFDAGGSPETPTGGLPQLRARVERIFGTFGTDLMPGLAGQTFSNPKERGDYPSVAMAALTDDVLIQMLILYVVDVYHNRPHAGLKGETPANCWKRLGCELGVVPDVPERVRRRAFGHSQNRKVSGRGVRVFGIDYTCSALRQFYLHRHETDVDIRVDLNDLGWIMVRIGEEWFPATALQKCFDGVSYDEWEGAARELRLKFRKEAALSEHIVADALQKIAALNRAAEATVGVALRAVTPAGLRRGEEDLFVGLSIDPDDPEDFDLPPDEDLFGHVIPLLDKDSGGAAALPKPVEVEEPEAEDAHETLTWRFDDE